MKKVTRNGILILISSLIFTMGFVLSDDQSVGRVNFLLGDRNDIKVHHQGETSWQSARLFTPVYNGDRFRTLSESRCELKLQGKGLIRIGENADFTFKHDQQQGKSSSILKSGRLWASVKGLFSRQKFLIRTPTAVCSVRGTIYGIDADSSTRILVYDGAVDVGPVWMAPDDSTQTEQQMPKVNQPVEVPGPTEVPGPFEVSLEQWVRIVTGYQIEVRADGKYNKTKIDQKTNTDDDWVKWNKTRDESK